MIACRSRVLRWSFMIVSLNASQLSWKVCRKLRR